MTFRPSPPTMIRATRLIPPLLAVASLAIALPSGAQYDSYGYTYGSTGFALSDQLRREREVAEWRLVAALVSDYRTAFKRPAPEPLGPTSWRAQNENPWANAYGTPSTQNYRGSTLQPRGYNLCTCYLPSDAKSWDGGPLTQADIARRCAQQCN